MVFKVITGKTCKYYVLLMYWGGTHNQGSTFIFRLTTSYDLIFECIISCFLFTLCNNRSWCEKLIAFIICLNIMPHSLLVRFSFSYWQFNVNPFHDKPCDIQSTFIQSLKLNNNYQLIILLLERQFSNSNCSPMSDFFYACNFNKYSNMMKFNV